MASDPNLTLVDQMNPYTRSAGRMADIERRLRALEMNSPATLVIPGAGPPSGAPSEGTQAVSTSPLRSWIYVAGAWHYVGLT